MAPHVWQHWLGRLRSAVRNDLLRTSQLVFLLALALTVVATLTQIIKQDADGAGAAMCIVVLFTVLGLRIVEYRRGRTMPIWADALELAGVLAVMSQMSAVYAIISTIFSTVLFRAAVGRPARLAASVAGYLGTWLVAAALFPAIDLVPGAMISLPVTSALVYSTRTLLLRLQEEQRAQGALLDAVLRRLPFPVLVTDGSAGVVLVNPAAEELLGWPAGSPRTLADLDLTDIEERPVDLHALVAAHTAADTADTAAGSAAGAGAGTAPGIAAGTVRPELEVCLARAGGDRRLKVQTVAMDGFSRTSGVVIALLDVTAQWTYQQHLHRAAYYDVLTGLPNRRLLWERLALAYGAGTSYAMLLIDLNDFKVVNDTLGHKIGDELLAGVAHRLLTAVRAAGADESAVVARLGGDEFAVMLPGASRAEAEAAADAVRQTFSTPLDLSCGPVRSGGSIGVATAAAGCSPDDVIAEADAAMYRAKSSGKRRTRAHDSPRNATPASA